MKINFNAKLSQKEKELLKTPFKKLVPEESRAWFFPVLQKMHKKLKSRGLMVYPNVWYSNEWFCPEGYNGIAIPFYLAHPKIPPLARKLGKYLEGTTLKSFERLIFHELGHAVEHAYGLSQQRWRVKTFGSTENPYPKKYRFDPKSKDFVRNLDSGYAQSHPDEDFAETFAVWMHSKKYWKSGYEGWPALDKLNQLDFKMRNLKAKRIRVKAGRTYQSLNESSELLKDLIFKLPDKEQMSKNLYSSYIVM